MGFRDEFQKYEELGVQIIGVSADPPQKQKKFMEKYGFQFPMLYDESHMMLEAYGVWGLKKFMGKEYMGITRTSYIINESGLIDKVYNKVKTKTHACDILGDFLEKK